MIDLQSENFFITQAQQIKKSDSSVLVGRRAKS